MKVNNITVKSFGSCLFLSLILSGFLFSCSTNETMQQSQYYVLTNQVINPFEYSKADANSKVTSVVVNELPRYLNQANLVMQMNDHQLHYTHHHMWAEPLQRGLTKALLTDLNALSSNRVFVESNQDASLQMLFLDIERFHVTDTSEVSLSGYYWLATEAKPLPLNKYAFNISLDLAQDGFSHAVEKMRELVKLGASEIVDTLNSAEADVDQ